MEPMIFTYLFTINGYDVTITIEYIVVMSLELTDDESESVDIFF